MVACNQQPKTRRPSAESFYICMYGFRCLPRSSIWNRLLLLERRSPRVVVVVVVVDAIRLREQHPSGRTKKASTEVDFSGGGGRGSFLKPCCKCSNGNPDSYRAPRILFEQGPGSRLQTKRFLVFFLFGIVPDQARGLHFKGGGCWRSGGGWDISGHRSRGSSSLNEFRHVAHLPATVIT